MRDFEAMSQPFPRHVHKRNPQGMTYIPVSEVIARMNSTIGVGNWKSEVISAEPFGELSTDVGEAPTHIVCHVRVSIRTDDGWVSMDGFGGHDVGFFKERKKGPMNLGDTYKSAASDAMKKALQHFGVALELARDDSVLAHEQREQFPTCGLCGEVAENVEELRDHMVDEHDFERLEDGRVKKPTPKADPYEDAYQAAERIRDKATEPAAARAAFEDDADMGMGYS